MSLGFSLEPTSNDLGLNLGPLTFGFGLGLKTLSPESSSVFGNHISRSPDAVVATSIDASRLVVRLIQRIATLYSAWLKLASLITQHHVCVCVEI